MNKRNPLIESANRFLKERFEDEIIDNKNTIDDNTEIEYHENIDYKEEDPWTGTLAEYIDINNQEEHGGPLAQEEIDGMIKGLEENGYAKVGGGATGIGIIKLPNIPFPKDI